MMNNKKEILRDGEKEYNVSMKLTNRKKLRIVLFILFLVLVCLVGRIAYIQFIQGKKLISLAYEQQTLERKISPKRGTIYDATGKNILASSSTVETVTVNPGNIEKEDKEKVAKVLSDIFEIDYNNVLKKVSKRSSIETIVRKVEKTKTDELRKWMEQNNLNAGINIDEDTKRYYPYNTLAAQIIGFCGSDNQGLDGLESRYDSELKGTQGAIQRHADAVGSEIGTEGENYVPATDGNSLVTTIDLNVQSIIEKYLKEACIDNQCTDGGSIIAMNPQNGDVLAMATYPTYNLNDPYSAFSDELKEVWDTLEQGDKTAKLQGVWRNKSIADTYEPGSVFKLITTSAALEEKITDTDNEGEFCCTGGIEVAGVRIKCWRYYRPHGPESLRQALMNSCNPIFIGLGQKLGVETYYSYLEKFGLLEKTGIDLYGEASSIFLAKDKMGPVELATVSFGQRFEITPIELATAVSSIANGGYKVKPRVVKEIINSQTGEKTELEGQKKEQIISTETSQKVLSMMESVVSEGTGKNAKVPGYRIGGKTGTSEDGVNTNKFVTSFLGVAPINDPQIVLLITLYNPTGEGGHQGGGVAAPIGGQIFSEVLPYLEVQKQNDDESQETKQVKVPTIIGESIEDAKKVLKEARLSLYIEDENIDETQTIVKSQTPQAGFLVNQGSNIYIEY